jgi:hypothetical protein
MAERSRPAVFCLNLRSKEMFYKDPAQGGVMPGMTLAAPDGDESGHGFDGTAYWCQCTQTGRGPDDQIVGKTHCSDPGRTCHVSIANLA